MKRFLAAAVAVAIGSAIEVVLPGRSIYHAGWYNVALSALLAVAIVSGRTAMRKERRPRARAAMLAILLGSVVVGAAGVANGLFAPDNQDVVGAPGERISVDGVGTLAFPVEDSGGHAPPVWLERSHHAPLAIGTQSRDAGESILRAVPRNVVYVEARDLRGGHLTITQPQGTVFLSPVLLMQHSQTIAGLNLPFDSFNVPAARRVVKAILFSAAQAAVVLHDVAPGQPAVLFAVDDENDRPLAHAIALSSSGETVRAGGLALRAVVEDYPAIDIVSAPNIFAVSIGGLLVAGGLIALFA